MKWKILTWIGAIGFSVILFGIIEDTFHPAVRIICGLLFSVTVYNCFWPDMIVPRNRKHADYGMIAGGIGGFMLFNIASLDVFHISEDLISVAVFVLLFVAVVGLWEKFPGFVEE